MYIPSYFKNEDLTEVRDFVNQNSFGILVTSVDKRPWGTHIPLEIEKDKAGNDVIYGHISRANPQWQFFNDDEEVLAIFNGPHAYVSSSWYGHENVPTWNYIAVHIYGRLQIIEEDELLYSLTKLVDKYEKNSPEPVRVQEFSDRTMKQVKGIVGFKIEITEIQAAYKLSQNRNNQDFESICNRLLQHGSGMNEQVVYEMRKLQ